MDIVKASLLRSAYGSMFLVMLTALVADWVGFDGVASPIRSSVAAEEATPAPENARAWIVEPKDGALVSPKFRVVFGLTGFGVAPAGVEAPNTGHHHLLIDTTLADYERPIPADERHRHFGKGQTEVELELLPGQHTLQLVLGDHLHRPHAPPVQSETITITVSE